MDPYFWGGLVGMGLGMVVYLMFYYYQHYQPVRQIENRIRDFVKNLYQKYPDDPRVKRLYQRHKNTGYKVNFDPETYTLNKGEEILFCVEDYSQERKIHQDTNLLMFVALHELAHVMSIEVGHREEFWQNFRFLLQVATDWKLYHPVDYQFSPTPYCKMTVSDNPFFHPPTLNDILWQVKNTV